MKKLKEYKKLMRDYGNPNNSMAAIEFKGDLDALVRAVREDCARVAIRQQLRDQTPTSAGPCQAEKIAAAIRKRR